MHCMTAHHVAAMQVRQYFRQQGSREVRALPAAIDMVRVNAITRGAHASSGGDPVHEAFSFMDEDGSGDLCKVGRVSACSTC